jgi:hypothetical protein
MTDDTLSAHPPEFISVPVEIKGLRWWQQATLVDNETGETIGFLVVDTPDDAPDDVREGLDRRRDGTLRGQCVCGARLDWGNRAERRAAARAGRPSAGAPRLEHRPECPGHEQVLAAAIDHWEAAENAQDGAR